MTHRIKKVVVLGSGIMGSGISCHLANVGLEVLMLDLASKDAKDINQIANTALNNAIKAKPAPLYLDSFAKNITTGNFEQDMYKISEADWIIEVVVERLDIKQKIYEQVETYRKKGTIVSSNTSGIPIGMMAEGRSDDFKANFLGTHFFNPPRYLKLLEIIPSKYTDPNITQFMMEFGQNILGKRTVLCKDTPAFIGNRVGVMAMAKIFELTEKYQLSIEDVDKLTGAAIARPNTGTYRLADLVGLDTASTVILGIKENCKDDSEAQKLVVPDYIDFLLKNNWLGDKTQKGFYEKTNEKDEKGKSIIKGLDLKTKTYNVPVKSSLSSLSLAKQIEDPQKRIKAIFESTDNGGLLVKESLASLFSYVSNRIPEIADDLYNIDFALQNGFAWDFGPFEYWDIIGVEKGIEAAESFGYPVANWVKTMVQSGVKSFYSSQNGVKTYYSISDKQYKKLPGAEKSIILDLYRHLPPVFQNDEIVLHDIGDGVLCLEFRSKMNAIGEGILKGIFESIKIAEEGEWKGLVIGNNAKNFSVGANLMMIAMLAFQQEWDQLNMAVDLFQQATMRCRYSKIPVVIATQGYVFGGGCETLMHCDRAVVSAESYIGLVEVGVGLIPGGGGTKEFALRASDHFFEGDVQIPTLIDKFKTIATACVGTSGYEAYKYGYLLENRDRIIVNSSEAIYQAKLEVLQLASNYTPPTPRKDILVLGQGGLASLYVAANSLLLGKYASEHDIKIAKKIAWVLCGGDLSGPTRVSEKYLLDIEREAFLSLCGEPKTMERIQFMLEKGKPLRN